MKIGNEVYVHGYVDEIRKDTIIIRNDGGYFGTVRNEIRYIEGDEIVPQREADTPQTSGVVWTENDMPTPTSYSTSASTADTPQTKSYYTDATHFGKAKGKSVTTDTADTPQTDSEIPKNALRSACTGCRFVGMHDSQFPCKNCVRKNKDYYDSEYTEGSR